MQNECLYLRQTILIVLVAVLTLHVIITVAVANALVVTWLFSEGPEGEGYGSTRMNTDDISWLCSYWDKRISFIGCLQKLLFTIDRKIVELCRYLKSVEYAIGSSNWGRASYLLSYSIRVLRAGRYKRIPWLFI